MKLLEGHNINFSENAEQLIELRKQELSRIKSRNLDAQRMKNQFITEISQKYIEKCIELFLPADITYEKKI